MRKALGWVAVLVVPVGVVSALFLTALRSRAPSDEYVAGTRADGVRTATELRSRAPSDEYVVLNEETYDVPYKSQVTLSILVSRDVSDERLRRLLGRLYSQLRERRGFQYQNPVTHVAIYAYLTREHAESGMGQWVGMLRKLPTDASPVIEINERQLAALASAPGYKYGLSEEQRKQVFTELVKAEDKAFADAERAYPLPDATSANYSAAAADAQLKNQMRLVGQLRRQYGDAVAARHGLTHEQAGEIGVEALQKDWALPPSPE